jgi:hypothetical protein
MIDLKYGKIDVPGVPDDEPCIIIRSQDVFAVGLLKIYYMFISGMGGKHEQVLINTIDAFIKWPKRKIPDTTIDQLSRKD